MATTWLAKLLFPCTMLSTPLMGSISPPFLLVALAQFPAYGWWLGSANEQRRLYPQAIRLAFCHLAAAALCVAIADPAFS